MTAPESSLTGVYELLEPGPGRASVLVVGTDSPLNPPLCGFLSKHERSQCNRYRHPEDRKSSTLMRGLLRLGAGVLTGEHPSGVAIDRDRLGRPYLVGREEGWDLNASRARSCCALILGRGGRCGIDIERLDPSIVTEGLMNELVLDETESAAMRADPGVFFHLWTRTEAVLKADGRGLSDGMGLARRVERGSDGAAERWETDRLSFICRPIQTPPGFVGMAAFGREGPRITDASAISQISSSLLEAAWG